MKTSDCWFGLYEYFSVLHWRFWCRTLEWTSGTCFVGVRISIQLSTSSTDRILQATLIITSVFSLLCHMNISFETYIDTIYWLAVHGSTVLVIFKSYVEDFVWMRSDSDSSEWFYRPRHDQICSWFVYFNVTIPKKARFTLDASFWKTVWVHVILFWITFWFVFGLWSGHLVLVLLVLEYQFNCRHLPLTAFYRLLLFSKIFHLCLDMKVFGLTIRMGFVLSMWQKKISYYEDKWLLVWFVRVF